MNSLKKLYFIISLLCCTTLYAQKLTGTWIGDIDGYEFLQVNLVQEGDVICGYSWDYVYTRKDDYCKQYITGNKNKSDNTWFLNGYSFMENHYNHSIMQFKLSLVYEDGDAYLVGLVRIKPDLFFSGGEPSQIKLKKISNKPAQKTIEMEECLVSNKIPPIKPTIKPKVPIEEPVKITPKKIIQPIISPQKIKLSKKVIKKDSLVKTTPKKIIQPIIRSPKIEPSKKLVKKDSLVKQLPIKIIPKENNIPTKIEGRPNKEIKRIIINERKITLNVYDNGTVDGDTVTILYNGKAIISHKKISEKPLTVELELDENSKYHSIVLFAENLGSIPPNTALLIFTTANKKRYELFASASLQQNAEIVFEYKP
jgi:hypothetical protein